MQHIYSFFENEQSCLQAILDIHNSGNPIELDPMFICSILIVKHGIKNVCIDPLITLCTFQI